MAATLDRVKKVILDKLKVDDEEVIGDASFADDLGADSLDLVDLVMGFEEEFDIEIPDEDTAEIKTVQQTVNYIDRKMSG